jgi:hypothetical protein
VVPSRSQLLLCWVRRWRALSISCAAPRSVSLWSVLTPKLTVSFRGVFPVRWRAAGFVLLLVALLMAQVLQPVCVLDIPAATCCLPCFRHGRSFALCAAESLGRVSQLSRARTRLLFVIASSLSHVQFVFKPFTQPVENYLEMLSLLIMTVIAVCLTAVRVFLRPATHLPRLPSLRCSFGCWFCLMAWTTVTCLGSTCCVACIIEPHAVLTADCVRPLHPLGLRIPLCLCRRVRRSPSRWKSS